MIKPNKFISRKNKKGLSEIIAVVIVILLVIITAGIVWNVVNGLLKNKTEGVKSCFDVGFSDQVTFNNDYTCYDSANDEVQFSLNIGDVEIDRVVVSISAGGSSKTFTLTKNATTITNLLTYPGRGTSISMPPKNGGLTYIALGVSESPDWIKIAPFVDEKQCDETDTIYDLYDCSLYS